jgi:hypothetical protein
LVPDPEPHSRAGVHPWKLVLCLDQQSCSVPAALLLST